MKTVASISRRRVELKGATTRANAVAKSLAVATPVDAAEWSRRVRCWEAAANSVRRDLAAEKPLNDALGGRDGRARSLTPPLHSKPWSPASHCFSTTGGQTSYKTPDQGPWVAASGYGRGSPRRQSPDWRRAVEVPRWCLDAASGTSPPLFDGTQVAIGKVEEEVGFEASSRRVRFASSQRRVWSGCSRRSLSVPLWASRCAGMPSPSGPCRLLGDRDQSAVCIQRVVRKWLHCRDTRSEFLVARNASCSLQRWWRVVQCQRRLQVLCAKLWWRLARGVLGTHCAAIRMQGGVRMVRLQRLRWKTLQCATILQAFWRGCSCRWFVAMLRFERNAALQIQRWYRQTSNKRWLLSHLSRLLSRVHMEVRAATSIQSIWRGLCWRKQHAMEARRLPFGRGGPRVALQRAQLEGRRRNHLLQNSCAQRRKSPPGIPPIPGFPIARVSHHPSPRLPCSARSGCTSSTASPRNFPQPTPATTPRPFTEEKAFGRLSSCASSRSRSPSPERSGAPWAGPSLPLGLQVAVGRPQSVDVDPLLSEMISRGELSCHPRTQGEGACQSDLETVRLWLQRALPANEIRAVLRVERQPEATAAAYAGVRAALGPERLLWHGTPWDSVGNITRHGFNRAYCGRHGAKLGRGTYFAEDAGYALRFCGRGARTRALLLAGVLPGRYCKGAEGLVEPPAADESGVRFDSTVDDPRRPRAFCVFRDYQALPLYVAEVA